jgi:putative ABC transport system permease protein
MMIRNYLKVALRNMKKHKGYTFINIAGLALGMACSLLILLHVQDELSYDRFHQKADRIYRVVAEENRSGSIVRLAAVAPIIAEKMAEDFPEILKIVRLDKNFFPLLRSGQSTYVEPAIFYADAAFFEIFDFPLAKGDPKRALIEPYSLVITEAMAKKYFGDRDPLGEIVTLDNIRDYKVTGVLKAIPRNSHLRLEFLASLITLKTEDKNYGKIWSAPRSAYTYILLPKGYDYRRLEEKLRGLILRQVSEKLARNWKFLLQPLRSIHLHSHLNFEIEPNGDIRYVYIFSVVAVFILLIACMNFMNLATARSAQRAKEVGVRKVLGAVRRQLARHFLGESFLVTLLALPLALLLLQMALPLFNSLAGKRLIIGFSHNPFLYLGLIAISLCVGTISGSYPAFFLSAFHPTEVLKGKIRAGAKSSTFRKALVIVQFAISITLVAGTLIIQKQLDFVRNERLGFDKEHIVVLPLYDPETREQFTVIKNEILKNPGVVSVSGATGIPGRPSGIGAFVPEGLSEKDAVTVRHFLVDPDYLKTFGIKVKEGRNFAREFPTDTTEAALINETAAAKLGWESALGKKLLSHDGTYRVIGVVEDFHFRSKHEKIEPLVLNVLPDNRFAYVISVKTHPGNIPATLADLQNIWKKISPRRPFEYFFLDEEVDKLYGNEEKLSQIFGVFSALAILIACLGLFGLASFLAEQRTKEIGIRKVIGSSLSGIVLLLTREFTTGVAAANLIAWPVAYFAMNRWLQSFAYRISIGLGEFFLSGLLALAIALATVSYQAVRAALANPVDSLRYE